jgi:hypothetical protein
MIRRRSRQPFLGLRFFDSDLMTTRIGRVRAKVTPERSIAASSSAWMSP